MNCVEEVQEHITLNFIQPSGRQWPLRVRLHSSIAYVKEQVRKTLELGRQQALVLAKCGEELSDACRSVAAYDLADGDSLSVVVLCGVAPVHEWVALMGEMSEEIRKKASLIFLRNRSLAT